ncbi:MAG TPA: DUF6049 family protein [Iamia sp.]
MIGSGARRVVAAVAATALVGLTGPGAGATGPPTSARPAAQAPARVGIRALAQDPWVTRGGTWSLQLALTGAPAGSTVTADLHERVEDRSQYEKSLLGVIDTDVKDSLPEVDVDAAEVQPDGARSVSLAVSLNQTPSEDAPAGWQFFSSGLRVGVYPVDIRVVDADGVERGRVVVHIVRVPSGTEAGADDPPILVAPVVRIGTGPTVDPQGDAVPDPGIARQVDDLTDGLAMGGGLPLTLVPRPESIEALARDEDADGSLTALQGATRTRQMVDGPYVEVPLPAWVDLGLTDELSRQRDRGNSVLTEHLGRADSSTWDARAGLSPAAAAALWPVGVRSVILAPGAVEGGAVTGPITIGAGPGTMQAVVPDAILSGALTRREDPVLAAADFAAELALRAATTEGVQGVVIDPPESWLDDPANVALADRVLLDPLAPAQPVTVAELLETVPNTGTRELAPTMPLDLGDYPERLSLARVRLSSYASLVGSGTPEVGSLDQRLLLSGSAALTADEQSAYVEEVLAVTESRFQALQAPDEQTVTLTSSDGDVPLTLLNDLDRPATVRVDLSSNGRVEVRDFPPTQTLQPGRNQLQIPVHARAPGDATIDITIRTTDGVVVIDEVDYTVRSTAVPGIGIVLSAGAVAFLLIWWARHWVQARRARRGGDDDGGGDDGPDGPEPGPDDDAPGATVEAPPELVPT